MKKTLIAVICAFLAAATAFADDPMYTGDIPKIPCVNGTTCEWTITTVS